MKFISFRTFRCLCIDFLIFFLCGAVIFYSASFLLKLFVPFIAAFFLYLTANPLNKFLIKQRFPRALCAFLSLFIISLILFFIIRSVSLKLMKETLSLTENYSSLYTSYSSLMQKASKGFLKGARNLSLPLFSYESFNTLFSSFADFFKKEFASLLKTLSISILNIAKNIPSLIVSLFTTVFTAFFLLKESDAIFSFFRSFFGEKVCSAFLKIKSRFFSAFLSYFKAQIIIESIIFAVLLCGFLVLKVNYSFLLALLCAFVDAVPLFGTGTILIPMSLFYFLSGKASLGWGLLLLYGIALLTRQLCEPKIIGKELGIHPLATIFALYTGMKLFGVFGLILGPLAAIFIKSIIFPE